MYGKVAGKCIFFVIYLYIFLLTRSLVIIFPFISFLFEIISFIIFLYFKIQVKSYCFFQKNDSPSLNPEHFTYGLFLAVFTDVEAIL